ncbi:hypothetical protein MJ904_22405 [Massilia sp. MB5]|uniref:hypothetical protein n=1 Tax=Massilia sp. MB5 TaxID=2919578 RepID=UPI001F0FA3C3|nr:hypothetical protein [Massilia sp. MB5]UMR29762.1 hypothetical protein MJ904_22405 [Massilia sp. MB5]
MYTLLEELRCNPERVKATQARTLDNRNLPGGLKGIYGLFGSTEWWRNIELDVIPVTRLSGVVTKIYHEGMRNEGKGFEMEVSDGSTFRYSCVVNELRNMKYYQVGKKIAFEYATEPLKNPIETPNGYEMKMNITLKVELEA